LGFNETDFGGSIVDTGSTLTGFPLPIYNAIISVLKANPTFYYAYSAMMDAQDYRGCW
jgi:hypothetical protein